MPEAIVDIERIGQHGKGVGYDDAKNIYFVPLTVPCDRARVRFDQTHKRYRDAELIELLSPSPFRKDSPCDYFTQCGGCDWLNWDYSEELKAKEAILKHVLSRADIKPISFFPILKAENDLGYRSRIQLRQANGKLGFYRKQTHDMVDIMACAIADSRINSEIARIRASGLTSDKRKLELQVLDDGTVACFEDKPHGSHGFAQVNPPQNRALQELVAAKVAQAKARNVLELYCGDGNLTKHYCKHLEKVIAIDSHDGAIEKANATLAQSHVSFLRLAVTSLLLRKIPQLDFDTLILDPPRSGTHLDMSCLIKPSMHTIIYVSCAPVAFTFDYRNIKEQFEVAETHPLDMFPHTHHIEFVSVLRRRCM